MVSAQERPLSRISVLTKGGGFCRTYGACVFLILFPTAYAVG